MRDINFQLEPDEVKRIARQRKICDKEGHKIRWVSGYPNCERCYEDPRDKSWEKIECMNAGCDHCYLTYAEPERINFIGKVTNPNCTCGHHTSK